MKDKVKPSLVWKALFQAMKRHCSYCDKDFECYYTCKEVDKKQGGARKESSDFCYCPHCYVNFLEKSSARDGARSKCHLLKKE